MVHHSLMSTTGLPCYHLLRNHLRCKPVQAACWSFKAVAWAQRRHCCYLEQAAPHGEGDYKHLLWRVFAVPGSNNAQACMKHAALQNYQLTFGNFSKHMLLCKLSEDSVRLYAAVQVMCLTLAAPNIACSDLLCQPRKCGQAQGATPLGTLRVCKHQYLPSFRMRGRAVCSAAGRWTMVCWIGCCQSVSCGTGQRVH